MTAVESSNAAVSDLIHNVPKVDAVRSSVDEYLSTQSQTPDFVLADPPRAGLGKHAVRHLLRLKPKQIHIVACDPATLARDMAPLLAGGYASMEHSSGRSVSSDVPYGDNRPSMLKMMTRVILPLAVAVPLLFAQSVAFSAKKISRRQTGCRVSE